LNLKVFSRYFTRVVAFSRVQFSRYFVRAVGAAGSTLVVFFVRFNKLSQTGVLMLTFARYFSREVVVDSASLFFQRSFARLSFSRFFFAGHHVGPTVTVTQNTSSATNTTPTAEEAAVTFMGVWKDDADDRAFTSGFGRMDPKAAFANFTEIFKASGESAGYFVVQDGNEIYYALGESEERWQKHGKVGDEGNGEKSAGIVVTAGGNDFTIDVLGSEWENAVYKIQSTPEEKAAAAEAAAADATAALDGDYNLPGATGTGDVLQQDALSMSWAGVLQPGTHTAEVLGFPSSGSSASPGGSAFGCSATGATGTAVSVIVLPGAVAMRIVRAPTPAPPARSYQYFHRFFSREVVSNQGRTITFSRYFVRASTTFNVFAISEGAVPIGGGPPVVQPQVVFLSFARSFNRAVNFARASYFSRLTAYFSRCFLSFPCTLTTPTCILNGIPRITYSIITTAPHHHRHRRHCHHHPPHPHPLQPQ
jgi:hypothetical protein